MDHRGRSVDPELVLPRQRYSHSSLPRQEKRAQSAAPTSIRLSKFYNEHQLDGSGPSTLPKSTERALINQHVNPYQEFPSLRYNYLNEIQSKILLYYYYEYVSFFNLK